MKFAVRFVEENLSRIFKFHLNQKRITGTLHEDRYTVLILSCSVLLIMRSISYKHCRENQNPHFLFNYAFFENRAVYEIVWKHKVEREMPQMTIWHMRIACRIPKDTNTHTQNM